MTATLAATPARERTASLLKIQERWVASVFSLRKNDERKYLELLQRLGFAA